MIKLMLAMFRNTAILSTILYLIIPTFAFKKPSNELMVANQRARMRQNHDKSDTYITVSFKPNTNPKETLPALIMDYGNMIRNDIISLDNSAETRKRGNVKLENYDQDEFKDIPCSCEQETKDVKLLGEDYFPPAIETRKCDVRLCPAPYGCKERLHNVTVLKRKRYMEEPSQELLPEDLGRRWIAIKEPVIVGCMCVKEY